MRVAEEEIRYSLDDDLIFFAMWFFSKEEGYCAHFSSSRILLKKWPTRTGNLIQSEANQEEKETVETQVTFGGEILEVYPSSRVNPTSIGFLLKGAGGKQEPIALSGL